MIEMSLGLEVAVVLGVAGMGILALPWSSEELGESRRALGEVARRLLGVRASAPASLVPGASVVTSVPAPARLRVPA